MAGRRPQDRRPDDGGFLSRWAERKREATERQQSAPEAEPEGAGGASAGGASAGGASADGAAPGGAPPERDFDPKDLPDIETLEKDSDFSVFMHEKVPEALRRRALRRLWRVDPVFAHLDGMNDYDEDYTDAALVVEGLKTAYQVGKGMLVEEPEAAAEAGEPSGRDESGVDEPAVDEPAVDEPGVDEPGVDEPGGDGPNADEPGEKAGDGEPAVAASGDADRQVSAAALDDGLPPAPEQRAQPVPLPGEEGKHRAGDSDSPPRGAAIRRRWGDRSG
ncbi:DUF3306 domain-containing protein [Pelagibius sp.]|uniref:DUF3306 domain-containing protein n=1 Tax=Pelagibius sp. TaxID=1931238 RepID=UPI003B500D56